MIGFEKAVLGCGDSRGAPLWWAYAARQFTYDKLPMDEQHFLEKYKGIALEFGMRMSNNRTVYVEQFDAGGMGAGIVGGQFVREGWYDVRSRNRLYQDNKPISQSLYLDKVKERIAWYCNLVRTCGSVLNPDFNSVAFMFAFEDAGLNEHQKEIVSQLWGLYTGKPMSRKEVAEEHGVAYERIRGVEKTCLRHMLSNRNLSILIKAKDNSPQEDTFRE